MQTEEVHTTELTTPLIIARNEILEKRNVTSEPCPVTRDLTFLMLAADLKSFYCVCDDFTTESQYSANKTDPDMITLT